MRPRPPAWPAGAATPPPSTPGPGTSSAGRSARSRRSSTCAPGCSAGPSAPPRWPGTRPARRTTRRTSTRWPPRPPRRSPWTPPWTTPRTASRCSAGSASPGSTTRTCTCAGRWRCASCSAAARPGAAGPPAGPGRGPPPAGRLAAAGPGCGARPAAGRARGGRHGGGPAAGAAAGRAGRRRVRGARSGRALRAVGARPRRSSVIDEELDRAGLTRPDLVDRRLGRAGRGAARLARPSRTGSPARRCAARSPGASCSASRRPAPTWPRCGPGRSGSTGGGWRLTGQKVWTSLAHEADWAICLARTDPAVPKHRGLTYFLVDMRSPGIEHPAAAGDHRPRGVQRGLPGRGVRARRLRGRGARRRAGGSPAARWPPNGWRWAGARRSATDVERPDRRGPLRAGQRPTRGAGAARRAGGRRAWPGRCSTCAPRWRSRRRAGDPGTAGGGAQAPGRRPPAGGRGDRAGPVRPGRRRGRRRGRGRRSTSSCSAGA